MAQTHAQRSDKTDTANYRWFGSALVQFLLRRQGGKRFTLADGITYGFLIGGTFLMFFPVLWLVMSSFKTPAALNEIPPSFFPYAEEMVTVAGYDRPLLLVDVKSEDGTVRRMARAGRPSGANVPVVDPLKPEAGEILVPIRSLTPVRSLRFDLTNYTTGVQQFPFFTFLRNSVVITFISTIITVIINSMAAFALSKYRFPGRNTLFFVIISTLMVPISVILIPIFLVISQVGWANNLLGVIIPPAATPTGVFLLRQYMLTIPDELLEAARIDGATEWRIYWRIMLPLTAPALAVLIIFSIMWRWNDFLWPLIVLGGNQELQTLQLGLNSLQGDLTVRWNLVLAMTVLSLIPITLVFAFLQKYIASGIASTGVKG